MTSNIAVDEEEAAQEGRNDDDFKFSAETVLRLNDRIQNTSASPFELFRRRRRRGVLSVRTVQRGVSDCA